MAMLDFAMQVALESHAVDDGDIAARIRPNDEFFLLGRMPKAK